MTTMEDFMNENWYGLAVKGIVPIYEDAEEQRFVVGRELYEVLNLKTPYYYWAKRVALKGKTEDEDFWTIESGRKKEHVLTLKAAFEIAQRSSSANSKEISLWLRKNWLD